VSVGHSGGAVGLKILVVEDSSAMRELIASACEVADGITVIETASGFEALKVLPREKLDLIITDINMPDINGLELINFVKKSPLHQDVPLFIISTESSPQDRARGLALGAVEYLTKPFSPEELGRLIRKHLGIS
jgi:two-component system chemotaxis response regulator CheY